MNAMRRSEQGFTLVEILVVVAIIGILAAIAIPQYWQYKQRAVDTEARSDIKNLATALEAYYVHANTYTGAALAELTATFGFRQTADVTDTIVTADDSHYVITGTAPGASATFTLDSSVGVITP